MKHRVAGRALLSGLLIGQTALLGCKGERLSECDALLATVERVATCDKLEQIQRTSLRQVARSFDEALERLADVGPDRAPAQVVEEARRNCTRQDEELRRMYEKVAPECLR